MWIPELNKENTENMQDPTQRLENMETSSTTNFSLNSILDEIHQSYYLELNTQGEMLQIR